MALVEISDIRKSYGAHQVLHDVSLTIEPHEVVALIGKSGSGKSTLLRCINGLGTIDSGRVIVDGLSATGSRDELRRLRMTVGMVFQSYNLFPHLTVGQNVTLAPTLVLKRSKAAAAAAARAALARVGLSDKFDALPEQLSGGQQQRVAIARALAMEPRVMLFDEVTSALDPEWTREVLKVMADLAFGGMTMVLVTHEMQFAREVATRVVFMHRGRVWESGPPQEIFAAPRTPELQTFLSVELK
ncbi:amino acid ABC transporter ATP-binding protein [Methylobacterium currus]|uniref:Amino acid ABC transporter ATP-binding protein n=1 Tax=Methylobacterium currus TaxID=2051553 RepID=A0A2R4WWJ6_9HYPH|nr:amino acid ABC transporter ATP-binding protein [Methylobacterium currus]AWB25870.1 amino acid ABC transporter ATP-binding protein [Methylobacterium currus]UHC19510.1 amino acid ABC transporter ATP-binding protein [Methylobacterium currus]